MGENKDNNENSEINENFKKLVKEAVKNLEILNNESIQQFLKEKKIDNAPQIPFFNEFMELILSKSIDAKNYDRKLNSWMGRSSLTFFSEIKHLLIAAKQKNETTFNQLVSKFLYLEAIRKIKKIPTNLIQQNLMDYKTLALKEKYQEQEDIDYKDLSRELNTSLKEIKEETKELEKLKRNVESKAHKILKLINDYLQTSRYFIGLLVALLDLLLNKLEQDKENYLSKDNSYLMLYRRRGHHYQKKIKNCLKYHPILTENIINLDSVKKVFETFVLKEYKNLRIHFAHHDMDVKQDQLKERIYKVFVNGVEKSFTLGEFNKLWEEKFSFFLYFKFLIAREFFTTDNELFNYVENRPKPAVFHFYSGKIIKDSDS